VTVLSEPSHPSGVLPETSPFRRCRKPFERLSNQIVKGRGKNNVVDALTVHPSSCQTSPGNNSSNGSSPSCIAHNASNTGSSNLLRQHASPTAVAFPLDATSSLAMNLTISSTLRQECIESGVRVWPSMVHGLNDSSHSIPAVSLEVSRVVVVTSFVHHKMPADYRFGRSSLLYGSSTSIITMTRGSRSEVKSRFPSFR
jgi:hypothetical protein